MTTNETKSVGIIHDHEKAAQSVVASLIQIDSFSQHIENYLVAGETVKMGAMTLFYDILRSPQNTGEGLPGYDPAKPQNLILDRLPEPDKKDGNNPDKMKIVRGGGSGDPKYVSFYTLMADDHPEGRKIQRVLDDLEKKEKNGQALDPIEHSRLIKKWQGRKNRLRAVFRKMGKLNYYFNEILNWPNVIAKPMMEDYSDDNGATFKQRPAGGDVHVAVINRNDPTKWSPLSVDQFLRLDPNEAKKKAGGIDKVTHAHLMATQGRDGGEERKLKPLAVKTFPDYITTVWNFMDKDDVWSTLSKNIHARDVEGKALAVNLYRLRDKIDDMINPLGKELAAWVDEDDKAAASAEEQKDAA
jgi:hypothetical protein